MSLFDRIGRQQPSAQRGPRQAMQSMRDEIGRISSDPTAYVRGKGYEIPDGMTDAKEITQHLLRTGQVGAQKLQQIMRMLGR